MIYAISGVLGVQAQRIDVIQFFQETHKPMNIMNWLFRHATKLFVAVCATYSPADSLASTLRSKSEYTTTNAKWKWQGRKEWVKFMF